MDKINIDGIIITPLIKIEHPKGEILHAIKKSDKGFNGFGEAYFSKINNGEIKGWNKHNKMTLNLVVPDGEVIFVIYDDRKQSKTKGNFFKILISSSNYKRLTIPPKLWVGFKGVNNNVNLILNIASMEHDPSEIERKDINEIKFNWLDIN